MQSRDRLIVAIDRSDRDDILRLADALDGAAGLLRLAKESGLRGVVASPQEIEAIREACGNDLVIVTPGIRPAGSDAGDQRRTTTPAAAIAAGADYIVVGRPITEASSP